MKQGDSSRALLIFLKSLICGKNMVSNLVSVYYDSPQLAIQ